MRLTTIVLMLLAATTAASCKGAMTDPGPGKRVELKISALAYQSGDTVRIDVMNLSDLQLTYPGGFCPILLQRFDSNAWVDISSADHTQGCPLSIGTLPPRATQSFSFVLPSQLSNGVFRILVPAPTTDIRDSALAEPPLPTREFTVDSPSL